MKKTILILLLLFSITSNAQKVSCSELVDFLKKEGSYYSTVSSYTLNSSWLYEVTAYKYNGKIYILAKIKENEYSYQTNTYIFCGIPTYNWNQFQYASYGDNSTYGERFHKYIFDYQCNCN